MTGSISPRAFKLCGKRKASVEWRGEYNTIRIAIYQEQSTTYIYIYIYISILITAPESDERMIPLPDHLSHVSFW